MKLSYSNGIRMLGIIAISFPILAHLMGAQLIFGTFVPQSMSTYYWTPLRPIFIISLALISIFLFSYRGHDNFDKRWARVAGICALLLVLFPVWPIKRIPEYKEFYASIHNISGAIMFATLAYFSLFRFGLGESERSSVKKLRNVIYQVCGGLMFVVLVIGALPLIGITLFPHVLYYAEFATFLLFGISWAVKGQVLPKSNIVPERKE